MKRKMNNQIWQVYSKQLLAKESKPLWVSIIKNRNPSKKRMGFAPSKKEATPTEKACSLFVQQLTEELQGKARKDMEKTDFTDDILSIQKELIEFIQQYPRYSAMFNEHSSGNNVSELSPPSEQERALLDLGFVFVNLFGNDGKEIAQKFIESGFPVNFQYPEGKKTLLHRVSAASGSESSRLANYLMDTGKCDYLLKDSAGNLAHDLAYRFNRDHQISERLYSKTEEQSELRGVEVDYKYGFGDQPNF